MVSLRAFDADVSAELLAASILENGYAIVRRHLDDDILARLAGELRPHLDVTDVGDPDAFMGHKTKRFGALLSRCPTTRDMVTDRLVLETADRVVLMPTSA